MTNEIHVAAVILLGWITNIVERPPEDGPRGNVWFRTNVISAVVKFTPSGFATTTNVVPVATNTVRLTIVSEPVTEIAPATNGPAWDKNTASENWKSRTYPWVIPATNNPSERKP